MSILRRGIGPGPTELIKGNLEYGFYGVTDQPSITALSLSNELKLNKGNFINWDSDNPLVAPFDDGSKNINWLKFASRYKTIYVADRVIKAGNGLTFGELIDTSLHSDARHIVLGDSTYRVRCIFTSKYGRIVSGTETDIVDKEYSEWENLIMQFTPEDEISHWSKIGTMTAEIHSEIYDRSYVRGNTSLDGIELIDTRNNTYYSYGWRPVLEYLGKTIN